MSPRLTTFQLATRLETDPGQAWMAAITADAAAAERLGADLLDELRAFGHAVQVVTPTAAADVVHAVTGNETCVVLGDGLDGPAWSRLDRARSRLEHGGTERVVFVMSEAARDRAAAHAPNLWSFLASAVYEIGDELPLPEPDREARLQALRETYGRSDQDLVAAAERREAPVSPEEAEWLVLLGRDDLLR